MTATLDDLRLSREGIELIAKWEGFRPEAYRCPGGIWTIGFGNTYWEDGRRVRPGETITRERALALKAAVVENDFARGVRRLLADSTAETDQSEFDAMVSLAYNIGLSAFQRSSVLRYHKAGRKEAAADAFRLWNKANGQVLRGLVLRREDERALYLREWDGELTVSPTVRKEGQQCPDAPKALPATRTGTGIGIAATATAASQVADLAAPAAPTVPQVPTETAGSLADQATQLAPQAIGALPGILQALTSPTAATVFAVVALAALAYIAYARWDDRRRGRR